MTGELRDHDFVAVTEAAAVAAAQTMGYGDRRHSDHVAVEAMREALADMAIDGRVVIGEGERDKAPMLYVGEEVGRRAAGDLEVDFAVDPLEGTNLCATGASDAMAVLAASERGGLLHAPDIYMDKIVVGPTARGRVALDAPVEDNLRAIAGAFDCAVSALTVVVLDRDRHRGLVDDIRTAGARIKLIGDGDLSTAIAAAVRGTGVHAVIGTGGAPEGVITAAAMRCLGGEIQGRLSALSEEQKRRLAEFDIEDPDRIYRTEELAPGDDILFCCTGVTGGDLLRGVRFEGGGYRTSTLLMSLAEGAIRFVETIHRGDNRGPVFFH
ncbi:MAG: class II fructose-bisphosphatase [Acidobacteriota bacterium]|nr:class II fructose-bisphosphatase [Acidobacteriota bacterium]MDE2923439.1 class II fructose-bisphosphatase [Acidobacteriota bacterium]MDE3263670.1 class II fructose-bisphosphatase [Acidobacteriota bacterium]